MKIKRRVMIMIGVLVMLPVINLVVFTLAEQKAGDNFRLMNNTNSALVQVDRLTREVVGLIDLIALRTHEGLDSDDIDKITLTINTITHIRSELLLLTPDALSVTFDNQEHYDLIAHAASKLQNLIDFSSKLSAIKPPYDVSKLEQSLKIMLADLKQLESLEHEVLDIRISNYQGARSAIMLTLISTTVVILASGAVLCCLIHCKLFRPIDGLLNFTKRHSNETRRDAASDELTSLAQNIETLYCSSKKKEDFYKEQAVSDSLTGLRNRHTLLDEVTQALEEAVEKCLNVAVLYIDLNKLKQINDSLGHRYGDLAIQEVAVRLCMNIRQSDTIFRVGGDEFVILLKNIDQPEDVASLFTSIQHAFDPPALVDEKLIPLSISMGVSFGPCDSLNPQELITFADAAMYYAKNNNLKQCYRFSHMLLTGPDRKAINA
ncbi:GGDEF domain-containing protein [Vibrio brasiliensis]|nr:GGDEF domain-containing protein [Vibrio brasiliensis]